MRHTPFPNAWYAYALPDGRCVVLNHDGSMRSSEGPIAAPGESKGCLYLVLNPAAPGLIIAGQAWQPGTNLTLTWAAGSWLAAGPVACGVYPCIFDYEGRLYVNEGCAAGTQGYRFARHGGGVVSGDSTYSPTPDWTLWEWTMLAPDLVVGQGENGGVLVWDNGVYRELVPERLDGRNLVCRFIHVTTTGETDADTFGLAFWGERNIDTHCYWGTLGELRNLPQVGGEPTPPQPPTPTPPTPPTPENPMTDTLTSSNGDYRLLMQNDGNLVIYDKTGPVWASGIPNPSSPQQPPVLPPPPPSGPVDPHARIGASFYTALTCNLVDPQEYAQRLANVGVGSTRAWLLDAWAVNAGDDVGQYPGYLPVQRLGNGQFDLTRWNEAYFDRLSLFAWELNQQRIVPQFTLLELYSWSSRKAGLQWVPDPNFGPFRNNVNGVRWGMPDDDTFFSLPDAWMEEFIGRTIQALGSTDYTVEIGNEMPEKAMHYRIKAKLRAAGYGGPISVNRNEDTPGQYWNMRIGEPDGFDGLNLHGKRDLGYLDETYPDELLAGRPVTFREMWPLVDAGRMTLSSDGCRKTTNVADAYDYPALTGVARDALARGAKYEHQLAMKLRLFNEGRINLDDIERYDGPFLRGIR